MRSANNSLRELAKEVDPATTCILKKFLRSLRRVFLSKCMKNILSIVKKNNLNLEAGINIKNLNLRNKSKSKKDKKKDKKEKKSKHRSGSTSRYNSEERMRMIDDWNEKGGHGKHEE